MEYHTKIVIIMVGLPARGKSYISRKIARFLNWEGVSSRIFCQGVYRQLKIGTVDNKFFDPSNQEERDKITFHAVEQLIDFINGIVIDNVRRRTRCYFRWYEHKSRKKENDC